MLLVKCKAFVMPSPTDSIMLYIRYLHTNSISRPKTIANLVYVGMLTIDSLIWVKI